MTVPPVGAGVQQPEGRSRQPDSASSGADAGTEPFAGLLASLRQEGDVVPTGAAPSIDPAALPHQQAKVFNADGFFPEGGPYDGARERDRGPPAAEAGHLQSGRPTDLRSLIAEVSGSERPPQERATEPTGVGSTSPLQDLPGRSSSLSARAVPSGRASAPAQEPPGPPTALEPPGEAQPVSDASEGVPIRQRSPAQRDVPRREGSALLARVSLEAAGAEASLVARVQSLTREERARLRLEVIALLARHGLSAGEIRLNGEAEPVTKFEREGD